MTRLTPKQQRFVQEYLIDLNAAASARRAGYSVRTADAAAKTGSRLLRQQAVRLAIRRAMLERQKRTEITADYVLSNLMEIVERSMQRAPVLSRRGEQLVDGENRHVWRFDGRTASRALELMGRHLGMFAEHARTSGGELSISWEGAEGKSDASSGGEGTAGDRDEAGRALSGPDAGSSAAFPAPDSDGETTMPRPVFDAGRRGEKA